MSHALGPYKLNSIITGDARELAKSIPDASVDVIFTDPPYPREYLPLYGWLAQEAVRVLKPGGFLCVMTGGYHLAQVFKLLDVPGLEWYFKIEIFNKNDAPVIFPRRIVTRTKPVLMYTKGKGAINIWNMTDVYQGQGKDKFYHEWGQDVGSARYVIEYVLGTGAGGICFEPFAGGGATLEACQLLGVDYLAFEIDPEAANRCRYRLSNSPKEPEQMPLFGGSLYASL